MAEALILSVIQKLETRRVESPITFLYVNNDVNEVIKELRMMVEFLRDKELEEGSRLHYLIDDVIEMAVDLNQLEDIFALCLVINSIKTWIGEVKERILRYGADEAKSVLENVAEGHDENVVVGLEEDIESLLHKVVFHADQGLCTSLFTGMVGMGKTTLAGKLSRQMLVTSRTKNLVWVHTNASTFHSFHEMKPLDSDQSWKLFLGTISSGNDSEEKFPKQLEKTGREMLKRCSGVPLAIKEVGMQLAKRRQCGSEWEDLFGSVDFGSILELLELSYHKLNPEAKLCFLHLACFKENTTMREEKLVQIWAAEGMISEKEYERSTYLGKLIVECIVEIKDRNSFYGMKSCSINSLQHMQTCYP